MKRILNKLKPVFLLFAMTFISLCIVFVVDQLKSEPIKEEINTQEENIVDNSSAAQQVNDTSLPEKITEDNQGIVLQAATGNPGSCKNALKIQSYSACERQGTGSVDGATGTRSGEMISKDAQIVLIDAPIPLELFAGSDVKDSNRKLTTTTPIYKPAGEQLDEKLANNYLTPGTQIDEYKPWSAMSPFSTTVSKSFLSLFPVPGSFRYSISHNLTSEFSRTGAIAPVSAAGHPR